MADQTGLLLGSRITGWTGRAASRIGAFARDGDGRFVALTARHVLQCESDPRVLELNSLRLIGEKIDGPRLSPDDEQPFHLSIGAVRLYDNFSASCMRGPYLSIRGASRKEPSLGSRIFKFELGSELTAGVVTGIGGSIRFVDPFDSSEMIYDDLVEVSFSNGGANPVASGEAGSLILDEEDNALGLLISGTREKSYVARLDRYLEAYGCRLVMDDPANQQANDSPITFQDILADLRAFESGVNRMKLDLRAEQSFYSCPEGTQLPDALRHILDAK